MTSVREARTSLAEKVERVLDVAAGDGGDAAAPVVRRPWIWVCGGQTQARDSRILCQLAPYCQRLPLLWLRVGEGEGGDEGALTRVCEGEEAVA